MSKEKSQTKQKPSVEMPKAVPLESAEKIGVGRAFRRKAEFKSLKPPRWDFWRQMGLWRIWDGVLLSQDIEPHQPWARSYNSALLSEEDDELPSDSREALMPISDLLAIAMSHFLKVGHESFEDSVRPDEFIERAVRMKWDLPEPMRQMAAELGIALEPAAKAEALKEKIKTSGADKEVSAKSETAYLNIIGALCELYWRKIRKTEDLDIVHAQIIEHIVSQGGKAPGLSERNLKEKISAAIRSFRSAS